MVCLDRETGICCSDKERVQISAGRWEWYGLLNCCFPLKVMDGGMIDGGWLAQGNQSGAGHNPIRGKKNLMVGSHKPFGPSQ